MAMVRRHNAQQFAQAMHQLTLAVAEFAASFRRAADAAGLRLFLHD